MAPFVHIVDVLFFQGMDVTDDNMIVIYTPAVCFMLINFIVPQCIYQVRFKALINIGVNLPAIVREIPHFGLFPAFLSERPAFLAFFELTKIAENRNNFSCTETFCST